MIGTEKWVETGKVACTAIAIPHNIRYIPVSRLSHAHDKQMLFHECLFLCHKNDRKELQNVDVNNDKHQRWTNGHQGDQRQIHWWLWQHLDGNAWQLHWSVGKYLNIMTQNVEKIPTFPVAVFSKKFCPKNFYWNPQ